MIAEADSELYLTQQKNPYNFDETQLGDVIIILWYIKVWCIFRKRQTNSNRKPRNNLYITLAQCQRKSTSQTEKMQ
jgi:hypothetical protein